MGVNWKGSGTLVPGRAASMRILVNGDPQELPEPESVAALLCRLGLDARTVAVELDRVVVKRARYDRTEVRDGAEVEVVAFVGGG